MSLWTADGFGSREESPCFWPRYSFIEWAKCIAQKPSLFTMAGASRIRVPTGFPHDPADGPVETVTSVLDTRPAAFSSAPQSIIQGITLPRVRCDAARHSLSLWGHVPPSCLPSTHHAPCPVAWLCASVLASVPRPAGCLWASMSRPALLRKLPVPSAPAGLLRWGSVLYGHVPNRLLVYVRLPPGQRNFTREQGVERSKMPAASMGHPPAEALGRHLTV